MSDLSEDEVDVLVKCWHKDSIQRRAGEEVRRHRSALAADRKRVREVVETEAAAVLGPNGPLGVRSWDVLAHQIATRVADQLATARPLPGDVKALLDYLDEIEAEADRDARSGDVKAIRRGRDVVRCLAAARPMLSKDDRLILNWLFNITDYGADGNTEGMAARASVLLRRLLSAT